MTSMSYQWFPLGSTPVSDPPPVGRLIAQDHAVWQITKVTGLPLSDTDRDVWLDAGMPDLATWKGRPQRIAD